MSGTIKIRPPARKISLPYGIVLGLPRGYSRARFYLSVHKKLPRVVKLVVFAVLWTGLVDWVNRVKEVEGEERVSDQIFPSEARKVFLW